MLCIITLLCMFLSLTAILPSVHGSLHPSSLPSCCHIFPSAMPILTPIPSLSFPILFSPQHQRIGIIPIIPIIVGQANVISGRLIKNNVSLNMFGFMMVVFIYWVCHLLLVVIATFQIESVANNMWNYVHSSITFICNWNST